MNSKTISNKILDKKNYSYLKNMVIHTQLLAYVMCVLDTDEANDNFTAGNLSVVLQVNTPIFVHFKKYTHKLFICSAF